MKRILFILCLTVFCWSGAIAADKVVIIPIGKTINVIQDSSSGNFYPVYDADHTFVGYYFYAFEVDGNTALIVSPQGYTARMDLETGQYPHLTIEYPTTACEGTAYYGIATSLPNGLFTNSLKGGVSKIPSGGNVYFPSPDIQLVTFTSPAYSYRNEEGECVQPGEYSSNAYLTTDEPIPNNSAVTGFQDSYVGPLKAEITIPAAP